MSRAAVSSLVNTLEREGLVTRVTSQRDRRAVILDLTEAGSRRILDTLPRHNARESAWADLLTVEEREQLTALLIKLGSGVSADWVAVRD